MRLSDRLMLFVLCSKRALMQLIWVYLGELHLILQQHYLLDLTMIYIPLFQTTLLHIAQRALYVRGY